jgi:LPS O-antigen subunit length determinant protein (WzzB/FepE family)
MSTQSILQQIQQLKELLRFTNTFKDELKARMSSYDSKVQQLYNLGVPVEFKNSFEANNHQPTKKQINTIVEAMEQRDIPFLKQQIQSLETALEIAKRNRI